MHAADDIRVAWQYHDGYY